MELRSLYQAMDVSHLSKEEVEHELLMRNMLFGLDEHDSVKRRKLKDRMKFEREKKIFVAAPIWRSVPEEMEILKARLLEIGDLLNNPKTDARKREKLRTRLIHYRVRIFMIFKSPGADKHHEEITDLGRYATQVFHKHFPESEPVSESQVEPIRSEIDQALEEVRSEIEILNVTATGNEDDAAVADTEASGGVKKKTIQSKKQELEASMLRCDEILNVLTGYEEGKQEDVKDVLQHFKAFVVQTTKQQKEMREREIALEEKRVKEAEENIERKKRLEKLLTSLNDQLRLNQERVEEEAGSSSKREKRSDKKTLKPVGKSDQKVETNKDLSTEESSDESSPDETENQKPVGGTIKKAQRKEEKREKSRDSFSRKSNKKRSRKVSFSSVSTNSTSSSSCTSSSEDSTPSSSESSSSSSDSGERRRRRHKKSKKTKRSLKRIPVSEWRLKYDGKDQGRRLAEFLKEIKMRCKSEDVSDRELFRSAIHLFSGRAKDWYMEAFENRDFHSWSGLKRELKREFLPPDLDYQIEVQATGRRQARGEKFVDYLHDMQKLFQSMTKPISERRKFEIIWRNMRFDYKNALTGAGVKSLSKLKRYGRRIDENNWNMFQKPSESSNRPRPQQLNEISATNSSKFKPTSSQGENSRTFFKSKPKNKGEHEQSRKQESKKGEEEGTKSSDPNGESSKGSMRDSADRYVRPPIGTCYNCRRHGHHYGDCSEKRQKFCRLCGFMDVITPECPYCQKNEQNSA